MTDTGIRKIARVIRRYVPRREDRLAMMDDIIKTEGHVVFVSVSRELRELDVEQQLRDERDAAHG